MKTILFICQANIGRSQMAEGFFNAYAKDTQAISAGVIDLKEKYNNRPSPQVVDVMMEEGIDISQQKVKRVTNLIIEKVDKVIVLCEKKECPIYLQENKKVTYLFVEDPSNMRGDSLRVVRDKIKKIVLDIVADFP